MHWGFSTGIFLCFLRHILFSVLFCNAHVSDYTTVLLTKLPLKINSGRNAHVLKIESNNAFVICYQHQPVLMFFSLNYDAILILQTHKVTLYFKVSLLHVLNIIKNYKLCIIASQTIII